MEKLVFINACIRTTESRTYRIAAPLIEKLRTQYEITTIDLTSIKLAPIHTDQFYDRGQGIFQEHILEYAETVEKADRIVIAAPFWDMSFPAVLKVFFEQISLPGYTFDDGETRCIGRCRCKKLLYITTRGMNIKTGDALEQAVSYLKALSWLWGLGDVYCIACENMDYISETERELKIQQAISYGMKLCEGF